MWYKMFKFCQHPLCFSTSKNTLEDLLHSILNCFMANMISLLRDGKTRNSLGSGFSETRVTGQDKRTHSPGVAH